MDFNKVVLTLCLVPFSAGTAFADPSASIPQVIVKASRIPVPTDQVGSAVTVIDRNEIERRQSVFLTDVLRGTPGLAVGRSGTFGSTTQVRLRGAEANQILVVVDGVEINDPSLGDEVDFAHMTTHAIERVEVVRGPQSALWGSDAVGGVINIVTRAAEPGVSGSAFVEGGTFGTDHLGARIGYGGATNNIAFNVSRFDTDGTNIARVGDEKDGYNNVTANLKGRLEINEQLAIVGFVRRTEAEKSFDGIDFFVTGLPVDADSSTDLVQNFARVSADLTLPSWTHQLTVTGLDTDNENFSSGNFGSSQAAEKLGVYLQSTREWSAVSLTLALDREDEEFEQRGLATPFGDPNQNQEMSSTGYVAELRGDWQERLAWSLGARFDQNSDFDDAATYRVTGSYRLSPQLRVRASLGTGQKRPTFTERFGFFADRFIGNPNLEAEESFGFEVGLEYGRGTTRFELGYFNEELDNEIDGFVFDTTSFLFTAQNRDGKSHREGFEATVRGAPTRWFDWGVSYSYVDADEPDGLGGQQREIRRPRHQGSVNFGLTGLNDRISLQFNAVFSGEQLDLFFPPFPMPSERVALDNFTLISLAAEYAVTANLDLVARVENLLDEEYEEVLGFAQPGRGAYLGLRMNW